MKAISIKQPWASLIVHGIKNIENRAWKVPERYIGQRVLIHASGKPDKEPYMLFNDVQADAIDGSIMDVCASYHQLSSIIGSVEITDCVINHHSIWAEKSLNKEGFIPIHWDAIKPTYNWVLANPILFDKPIPAKGKLSFWEFDGVIPEEMENIICPLCGDEFPIEYGEPDNSGAIVCPKCASRFPIDVE